MEYIMLKMNETIMGKMHGQGNNGMAALTKLDFGMGAHGICIISGHCLQTISGQLKF